MENIAARKRELETAISKSDDIGQYQAFFLAETQNLIDKGRCQLSELKEQGGWVRSVNRPGDYFVFCGGLHVSDRVYIKPE